MLITLRAKGLKVAVTQSPFESLMGRFFVVFSRALLRFHCISCDRPVDMIPGQ